MKLNLDGDIRNLLIENDFSVKKIKEYIQSNKNDFPYLGGNKMCNYWLYVLEKYTDIKFVDRENITVIWILVRLYICKIIIR